ncbi:hypothetical protein ACFT9M_04035 [Micromonospora purpureochromogenes]|uniref:hypothetical protein n=1 Tax=Micromonospora purpureochromogenes TaxID=47872 RepID=UPI00363A101C
MTHEPEEAASPEIPLAWLADAPLFIDAEQVSAFYDAVVMPEHDTDKIAISTKNVRLTKTNVTGKAGARVSTSAVLATIFPFIDAQANLEVGGGHETSSQSDRGDTIELRPIKTPHRQLVQLALHYSANLANRVTYIEDANWGNLLDASYASASPRALVFLDLPPRQPIIPLAAELTTGRVVTLFDDLAAELSKTVRTLPPNYPAIDNPEETREYWAWYSAHYSARAAMNVLERGIGEGGLVRWVDYRLRMNPHESLHLSMRGRGGFETGIFAFSTIFRGHEHGLRIVGTLKSGPGLNILALFEK